MNEGFKSEGNKEQIDELNIHMKSVLRDYCNHFVALKIWYERGGLTSVKQLIQEFKIESFQEYFANKEDPMISLTDDELNSAVFKKHVAILDTFANQINTYGQEITEEIFTKGMDEVKLFVL